MDFEISLNDLRFYAYHGVEEFEREFGNKFNVSLSVKIPYDSRIREDDLNFTVSYADLYSIVEAEMLIPRNLLETVAVGIAGKIKERFPIVTGGKIRIEKDRPPIPGMLGSASVILNF